MFHQKILPYDPKRSPRSSKNGNCSAAAIKFCKFWKKQMPKPKSNCTTMNPMKFYLKSKDISHKKELG